MSKQPLVNTTFLPSDCINLIVSESVEMSKNIFFLESSTVVNIFLNKNDKKKGSPYQYELPFLNY
jgi:hypothetical protein